MAPPAAALEGATRSGRINPNMFEEGGVGAGVAGKPGANWTASVLGKRQRTSEKSSDGGEDGGGAATPGPNTPATTGEDGAAAMAGGGAVGAASEGGVGGGGGGGGGDLKKQRAAWSQEAVTLGYEAGTIKNSAYLLLAASGAKGMTVAAIVDAATKQG